MISTIASDICGIILPCLPSGTVAVVDYSPEFALKDLAEMQVVVVPVGASWQNLTRKMVQRTFDFEVGVLQRVGSEGVIATQLTLVESIALALQNAKTPSGFRCKSVKASQLYNPEDFRQSKKCISVLRVEMVE